MENILEWTSQLTFFDLTVELIIGFFALFTTTKLLRKTQINQISPFDFISALVLGELLGNAIYDKETGLKYIIYALTVWGVLVYAIEKISQKFRRSRKLLDGDPAIIIRDGQIDFKVIKKEKLDINELLSILRQKDVFSVREVEFAILESSGAISVLKKSKYSTPTIEDMKLKEKPVYLPINIILDGEIIYDNLKAIGLDEKWLDSQLRKRGIKRIEDVFYGEWKQNDGLHIVRRTDKKTQNL